MIGVTADEWLEHAEEHLANAHKAAGALVINDEDLGAVLSELACLAAVIGYAREALKGGPDAKQWPATGSDVDLHDPEFAQQSETQ